MVKYNKNKQIMGALRVAARFRPENKKVKEMAVSNEYSGVRGGKMYICNYCKNVFGPRQIHIDHIKPVIPLDKTTEDMSWDEIIDNLFCPIDNLQVLCIDCHHDKSAKEKHDRV